MAAPRTRRLAGSVTEGRITWVQRSRLMAFPDHITAEVAAAPEGTRLDVVSRQRYGSGELGVNAARLRDWLARLQPFHLCRKYPGGPGAAPPAFRAP
jgi:uncharacterized protein (DUF1499 family)